MPQAAQSTSFTLCCSKDNDLLRVMQDSGIAATRFDSAEEAVEGSPSGGALLLLAPGYPDTPTSLSDTLFEKAAAKQLRLLVEYPQDVPGLSSPGTAFSPQWERAVVAGEEFGKELPRLKILGLHGCTLLPYALRPQDRPLLVMGRVAGFDTAVFGLPQKSTPVLFEMPERRMLVASTCLSRFVRARYAPAREWKTLWESILSRLAPCSNEASRVHLTWTSEARPMFGPKEALPPGVETAAFRAQAQWCRNSGLLLTAEREQQIRGLLRAETETTAPPLASSPSGDGSCGILEGYASGILPDGTQLQRTPLRADCQAESAMVFCFDWLLNHDALSRQAGTNLFDYLYGRSGMCLGARGNPRHPSFGLIAWGVASPSWEVANYGDDNARVLLATLAGAACLKSSQWDKPLLRGLLANLRTTGKLGFRGDRIDMPQLEANGWKHYAQGESLNPAPGFESYLWACYLWGYARTHHAPFLEVSRQGITHMMQSYSTGSWRLNDASERARMVLPLAWLVRVEDTPQHREWLKQVAGDLVKLQDSCGAIREEYNARDGGTYKRPQSNEAYGTSETPLIQNNGDCASDQLYTTGFALLGLHEAVAATGDQTLRASEDRLAEFLCRIQVRAPKHPWLNGAWFRAFDFGRWEYWASSADMGWGAWCLEAGWAQSWTACALALRAQNTSLWQLSAQSSLAAQMETVMQEMSQNNGEPWTGK